MSELTCPSTPYTTNDNNLHVPDSSSAPLYELHQVIQQYQAHPDLLKLILTSKVEEDKRRAEEAKLRAKELDYYIKHDSPAPALLPPIKRKLSISSPCQPSMEDQQRRHSAATAMLAMSSPPSNESTSDEDIDQSGDEPRSRRRREMHAITKIVETREFPYLDRYFWRNNGNTTQKKTGCRSIYYKCSNSNKGCKVNKTVTAKQNGEYLIKYRGAHLPECGMVERIRDL
ncbi:hypothetical protein BC941DRAFT_413141 [Chlamydoabsidia padenii]|nr:hypothetical protein BC941DRAFT_413141 [Chlamydoabsidia padenii]